jgi:hypothetical protein
MRLLCKFKEIHFANYGCSPCCYRGVPQEKSSAGLRKISGELAFFVTKPMAVLFFLRSPRSFGYSLV